MTENKNQNQNFLQEEDFEEELFDVGESNEGALEEKEFTPKGRNAEDATEEESKEGHFDKDMIKNSDKEELLKESDSSEESKDQQTSGLLVEKNDEEEDAQEEEEHHHLNEHPNDDKIYLSKSKLLLAQKLIRNIKENNDKLFDILGDLVTEEKVDPEVEQESQEPFALTQEETEDGKVIEGVFNGVNMIGPDGQSYTVPANYASKSKLVEGDVLKLTITPSGGFVYKQIQLVERKRMVGTLQKSKDGDYIAHAKGKIWKLLPAGVTYFKGEPGDEVIFLVPQKDKSKWGAVENIVKK